MPLNIRSRPNRDISSVLFVFPTILGRAEKVQTWRFGFELVVPPLAGMSQAFNNKFCPDASLACNIITVLYSHLTVANV